MPVSPKSYAYLPFVREGHAEGSIAIRLIFLSLLIASPRYGRAIPLKLLPPPVHPTTMSGYSSKLSICFIASCPIIVWCNRTWFRTEPSAYLIFESLAHLSTASEIAIPRLPVEFGFSCNIFLPISVSFEGLAIQRAPKASIIAFLYGFCIKLTLTINTSKSIPNFEQANAKEEPHCPAPVSVVILSIPSFLL